MHWREMEDKTWMALQPLADFFAMMRRDIVTDHVNRLDPGGNLRIKRGKERDKLALAFAAMTLPIDMPSPGIKGGKQVQGPIAPIFMFNAVGESRLCGFRGMEPRPWLQGGFFIEAEDHFLRLEGAGVEGDQGSHLRIEGRIAGIFRRQPHMMPPWFELMMGENTADR